jgi:uncharacterized protein YuzE
MRVEYFPETDTLDIEFKPSAVAESKDLDENIVLDLDADGRICAMAIEHARERTDYPQVSFEPVAA